MSQKTNIAPIKFKCPNGKEYTPKQNIDNYNFQLRHSPLARHTEKNPGNLCYINQDNKFGEVGGCSNEPSLINYTTPNIINRISNDSFSSNIFIYDNNYISQPPNLNLEKTEQMNKLDNISEYDDSNLYKKYCMKQFKDSYSLDKMNKMNKMN
mgnify:FL=1